MAIFLHFNFPLDFHFHFRLSAGNSLFYFYFAHLSSLLGYFHGVSFNLIFVLSSFLPLWTLTQFSIYFKSRCFICVYLVQFQYTKKISFVSFLFVVFCLYFFVHFLSICFVVFFSFNVCTKHMTAPIVCQFKMAQRDESKSILECSTIPTMEEAYSSSRSMNKNKNGSNGIVIS